MNINVLCVSGDYRSGKSGFSEKIAKQLDIEHYSMRKLKDCETELNRDCVNWDIIIQKNDNIAIDNIIVNLARKGKCVLDFRFGAVLCKKYNIPYIGIWISADLKTRIEGNSFCWRKSEVDTESIINKRETEELNTCLSNYGVDYRDKSFYSIYIDLTQYWYPIEEAVGNGMKIQSEIIKVQNMVYTQF